MITPLKSTDQLPAVRLLAAAGRSEQTRDRFGFRRHELEQNFFLSLQRSDEWPTWVMQLATCTIEYLLCIIYSSLWINGGEPPGLQSSAQVCKVALFCLQITVARQLSQRLLSNGQFPSNNRRVNGQETGGSERLIMADWVKSPTAAHAQSGSQKLDSAD
ncbi:hypothetical protein [Paraburkholderia sp. RCC_158]|uniref:hypothetical protein n=1 Tax=Paraburkholderia sp. RCC_158 TaxID=3239220 RepID=UPI003526B8BB